MRTYSELIRLQTYKERLEYLKLSDILPGAPGKRFHVRNRRRWDRIRRDVIARDLGYDLGIPGMVISGRIIVHHMNPVTDDMICEDSQMLYDMDNLISVSSDTHEYIHYGKFPLKVPILERFPGDTKLW